MARPGSPPRASSFSRRADPSPELSAELAQALAIAQRDLLGNVAAREWWAGGTLERAEVILAGRTKFSEVWARDAAFAVPALLALGRPDVVRNTLRAFYDLQHPDGGFARRLSGTSNVGRNLRAGLRNWFGIELAAPPRLRPEYITSGSRLLWHRGRPKDVSPLVLGATAAYCAASGDAAFAHDRREGIHAALESLRRETRDGLVWQHHFEDWEDHTRHTGFGLYTNVLLYQALRDLQSVEGMESLAAREELATWAAAVEQGLQGFWIDEQGYFAHFLGGRPDHRPPFSVAGNMLTITSGIATPDQRERVMDQLASVVDEYGYVPIAAPGFPLSMAPPIRAFFVRHYLSGRLLLPWIQLLAARAVAPWRLELATRLTEQVAEPIIRYGTSLEALYEGHTPLRYVFTAQEHHFTWGSAALHDTCTLLRQVEGADATEPLETYGSQEGSTT